MQCSSCGKELTSEDVFCSNCGTAVVRQTSDSQDVQTILQNTLSTNNVGTQPVVQAVTEAPLQSPAPVEVATPVNNTNVEVSTVQSNPTEIVSTSLTPPESKDINQKEEIEYNVGRQTTFVTSDVQSSAPAQEATVSTVQPEAAVETQAVVETPEYQAVTFGPAPIIDPPVIETPQPVYNSVAYDVPNKKGMSGGALVGIIAIVAFVFLAGGIGVGLLLFGASNTSTKGTSGEVKTDLPTEELVEVEFGGSKFSIPYNEYDYELDNNRLAIYNDNIYFYLMVSSTSYPTYLAGIPKLKDQYEKENYTVSSASEEKVDDQRYIILNIANDSGKVSLFIRKFTNTQCLTGAIARTDDSYATSKDLSAVESIISSSQIITRAINTNKERLDNDVLKGIIEANFDEEDKEESKEDKETIPSKSLTE